MTYLFLFLGSIGIIWASPSLPVNPGGIGGLFIGPNSEIFIKGPDGSVITATNQGGEVHTDIKVIPTPKETLSNRPIVVTEPQSVIPLIKTAIEDVPLVESNQSSHLVGSSGSYAIISSTASTTITGHPLIVLPSNIDIVSSTPLNVISSDSYQFSSTISPIKVSSPFPKSLSVSPDAINLNTNQFSYIPSLISSENIIPPKIKTHSYGVPENPIKETIESEVKVNSNCETCTPVPSSTHSIETSTDRILFTSSLPVGKQIGVSNLISPINENINGVNPNLSIPPHLLIQNNSNTQMVPNDLLVKHILQYPNGRISSKIENLNSATNDEKSIINQTIIKDISQHPEDYTVKVVEVTPKPPVPKLNVPLINQDYKLLNAELGKAGLDLSQVYLTQVPLSDVSPIVSASEPLWGTVETLKK